MKNGLKKIIAVILVLGISVSLFAACGKDNTDAGQQTSSASSTVTEEQSVLKINFLNTAADSTLPDKDNVLHKWLAENKKIEFEYSSVTENQEDRLNMMLASGDIPDVVSINASENSVGIANKWADAGYIIETGPILKENPSMIKYADEEYNNGYFGNKKDGKLYVIPTNPSNADPYANVGPMIREDWLKAVGMEVPENTEQLFEVLKAFKEKIPDVDGKPVIPATFNHFKQVFAYSWVTNWWKMDNGNLDFLFTNPALEDYFIYMNKLYLNGLLDREVITQKEEQFVAKASSGRVGFIYAPMWTMDQINANLKQMNPEARFIPSPPIKVDGKPAPIYTEVTPHHYAFFTISSKFAENKENLKRLVDYLVWNASTEGQIILNMGPEGEFAVKSSEGLYEWKEEVKTERAAANNVFKQKSGIEYYNIMAIPVVPSYKVDDNTPESKMVREVWKEAVQPVDYVFNMCGVGPLWNSHWGKYWEEIPRYEAKAFYADSEEKVRAVYKEFSAAMKALKADEVVREKETLYKEYVEKNK